MEQNLQDALGALERARVDKLREVEQLDAALRALRGMIIVVPGGDSGAVSSSEQPYVGMGIVEAAERVLRAAGAPLTTREVCDAMSAGGWTTRSQNKTATVYSTLTNAKRTFVRNERGQWALVIQ